MLTRNARHSSWGNSRTKELPKLQSLARNPQLRQYRPRIWFARSTPGSRPPDTSSATDTAATRPPIVTGSLTFRSTMPTVRNVDRAPRTRQLRRQSQLLACLVGVLLVTLTMSRHWVICRHNDGDSHLTLQHGVEKPRRSPGCTCGHAHRAAAKPNTAAHCTADPLAKQTAAVGCDSHRDCSHIDLFIELDHERSGTHVDAPLVLGMLPPSSLRSELAKAITETQAQPLHRSGPPRPRLFWLLRATTLLLI